MKLVDFIKQNKSMLLNIYIVLNLGGYAIWQTYNNWNDGNLDYVEIGYLVQSMLVLFFILTRREHKLIDKNVWHQAVALFAFFSGVLFVGQSPTGGETIKTVSKIIIFTANVLGAVSLLNMGKSFGILIALRKVRTGGLYSIIRHPMYATDLLLRVGFVISHFNAVTVSLIILSAASYIYRAILEERLLSQDEAYVEYKARVKYRLIPFVF